MVVDLRRRDPDFIIPVGDLHSPLRFRVLDPFGNGVDLETGVAAVAFSMDHEHRPISIGWSAISPISGEHANDQPLTGGYAEYRWQDGDTDVEGRYRGKIRVTFTDQGPQSFPTVRDLIILVRD